MKICDHSAKLLGAITPADGTTSTPQTDALYQALQPLHDALEGVAQRLAEVQRIRRAAEMVEEDPTMTAFFERIKQTCDAIQRLGVDAGHALDRLTDASWQLDQYAVQIRDAMAAKKAKPAAEFVTLSAGEVAHLRERAALAFKTTPEEPEARGGVP